LGEPLALSESDTGAEPTDPAICVPGWMKGLVKREETASACRIDDQQHPTAQKYRAI
jgi:hypothetical protein